MRMWSKTKGIDNSHKEGMLMKMKTNDPIENLERVTKNCYAILLIEIHLNVNSFKASLTSSIAVQY